MSQHQREGTSLALVETVRCLECGEAYSRPRGGGTVSQNPGCPACGYLGWVGADVKISEELARRRFGEDRRRSQTGSPG